MKKEGKREEEEEADAMSVSSEDVITHPFRHRCFTQRITTHIHHFH